MNRVTIENQGAANQQGYVGVDDIAALGTSVTQRVASPRAVSSLVLAAVISAALVVVQHIIEQWSQGLAAWMVLWAAAFVSMALFSNPARRLGVALRTMRKTRQEDLLAQEQSERVLRATLYDSYMEKNRFFAAA